MERELPFNPYEVCRNIAMERTTFKVGDTQIIFEPQFTPLHAFKGTALYFRQIVKGKLHARSEFVTREDLDDEVGFNAKFEQFLREFENSLNREL